LAVPRIWEKFEDSLKAAAAGAPKLWTMVSGWAKGEGTKKVVRQSKGLPPSKMFEVADFLVLSRIRQAIGLDKCRFFLYGAAPLKQTTVDYFNSLNMPLFNCYGLSETTGGATV